MSECDGLVAIVTGGGSGIGLATASMLAERGARVAALDVRPPHSHDAFEGVCADVTDQSSVDLAIAQVVARFGALDVVVNNAGIGAVGTIEENSDAQWHAVFDVNIVGIVRVMRAALPVLRRSQHAAVVNTCSIVANAGLPKRVLYGASKGAVQALTLAMAADLVPERIRVNCVNPGTVDTPWVERLLQSAPDPAAERVALEARQPLGRLIRPQEVADAIAYLAGPRSAGTTGSVLAVDGGMHGLRVPR